MTKIIINPLGWNTNIFYKLNMTQVDYIIEFNNLDTTNLEKKIKSEIEKILSLSETDNYIFYAFSYGGVFLNHILESNSVILSRTSKVFYYDSFNDHSIPSKEELNKFRKTSYNNIEEIFSDYLDDEERNDERLKSLVLSQFEYRDGVYYHYLNNNSFHEYLTIDTSNDFIFQSKDIEYKIYNSQPIENVDYTEIPPENHLMMLNGFEQVQKDLKL